MQTKTASVAAVSASVGFNIHKGKTKVLKFKAENNNPTTLDGETLENIESFTYLGSIIERHITQQREIQTFRYSFMVSEQITKPQVLHYRFSMNIDIRIQVHLQDETQMA
ncbi:unnamed protein product [Schistosoma margrebowiei]|uniref:Uncharacterized protein n=1 Tax=Schistosoma margrebowiei TaxID=48269 RepID=A0A183NAQ7_9TREM|nr:unnamed protein product [Schistosoma margrebowiei]